MDAGQFKNQLLFVELADQERIAQSGAHLLLPGNASSGTQWSKWLVETHTQLGHRISLPPANLELTILDELPFL